MNTKLNRYCLYLAIIVLLVNICGCGQKAYNKHYYLLDTTRDAVALNKQNEMILEVQMFTIDSAFESKGLVYRKSQFEYETDICGIFQ